MASEWPKFSRSPFSSIVGVAIMRQRNATENSHLVATVVLPKEDAERIADKFLEVLREDNPR